MAKAIRKLGKAALKTAKADFIKGLGGDLSKLDEILAGMPEPDAQAIVSKVEASPDKTPNTIIEIVASELHPESTPQTAAPAKKPRKPRGKKKATPVEETPASNVNAAETVDSSDIGESPFEQFKREQPEAYNSIIAQGVMTDDDLAGFTMDQLMTTAEVGATPNPSKATPAVDAELEAELDANMPQSAGAGMALPPKRDTDAAGVENYLDGMEEEMMPMGNSPVAEQGGLFAGATPQVIEEGLNAAEKAEFNPGSFSADTNQMSGMPDDALTQLQAVLNQQRPQVTSFPQADGSMPRGGDFDRRFDTEAVTPRQGALAPVQKMPFPSNDGTRPSDVIRMMQQTGGYGSPDMPQSGPSTPTGDPAVLGMMEQGDMQPGVGGLAPEAMRLGEEVKANVELESQPTNWPATENIRQMLGGSKAGDLVGTVADTIYGKDGRNLGGMLSAGAGAGLAYQAYNAMTGPDEVQTTPEIEAAKKADFDRKVQAVREQFINKDMQ